MGNEKEGKGQISEKSEAAKADGTKYWKFKINMVEIEKTKLEVPKNTSFSLWEYPAGHDVSVNDVVQIFWTEVPGTGKVGQPITYRNLNSIAKGESIGVPKVIPTVADYDHKKRREIMKGQCFNKTVDICIAKGLDIEEHGEIVFKKLLSFAEKVL